MDTQNQQQPDIVTSQNEPTKKPLDMFKNLKLPQLSSKHKKAIITAVVSVIILLLLLVLLKALLGRRRSQPEVAVLPSPTPTPTGFIRNPSEYALDPQVLAIEENVKKLESDLIMTKLDLSELQPPNLDFGISF